MSIDSNRSSSQIRSSGPITVSPHHVTDPTILDSVAGFINEVVPTTNNTLSDTKDQIQWAHFEQLDYDETIFTPNYEYEKIVSPSVLILLLGYTTGIQVWSVPANGDATEILSWRHGSVRTLKILPAPHTINKADRADVFASKRPVIAICDNSVPGSPYSCVNFLSLKTSEQVKLIKFKNPVLNIYANKRSVVVTFQEKIAVFDAFTLEDRLTVTTCYLSPGLQPNPIALGTRWMAYAEKKLITSSRSSGGNDGEGVQSYTATVIYAAKSLGRGLRELGETVASSLTGNPNYKPGTSPNSPQAGGHSDVPQKGVVTILDIEYTQQNTEKSIHPDAIVAHFTAHMEAIVYLHFDPSGLLLLTADKRGHDFHLFRIHPHPGGPALAAVHHLYILHRGDTSARVQDMCFSPDSRWAAVSTLRGTTHVFPITPYGGNVGVRTHATPHVVNKMSRFHRSAGLSVDGRSNSPVSVFETPTVSHVPYHNPRYPPYPHPTVVHPLAQIRQPVYVHNLGNVPPRPHPGRQRLTSSSEENIALGVVSCFASPRAWLDKTSKDTPTAKQARPVDSLFVMSCHGTLVQYDLDPHQASSIPKEKVCNDTPIELSVCAKAQWLLRRQPDSVDLLLPMSKENLKYFSQNGPPPKKNKPDNDDHWLSQVEIVTHAGPHRRLWMGPQFTFKTYTTTSGSPVSITEGHPIDLGQSKPVNMPVTKTNAVLIESSSASSCEQSLLDTYQKTVEEAGGAGELQLREDLADAMLESPGIRDTGGRCVIVQMKPAVVKVVNPLGTVVNVHSDDDTDVDASEEIVILENCDEALFRPIVAPKAVLYHEKSKQYGDTIITKNLDSATEVAVKIIKKDCEPKDVDQTKNKVPDSQPKYIKEKTKDNKGGKGILSSDLEYHPTKSKRIAVSKMKIDISDPFIDTSQIKSVTSSGNLKEAAKIPVPEPLENISISVTDSQTRSDRIENEDFYSLEAIVKEDTMIGQTVDCKENSISKKGKKKSEVKSKKDKYRGLDDSSDATNTSEENVIEEKSTSRKSRKPRTKLGVKIGGTNKDNSDSDKNTEDCSTKITLPAPPKKSWSSICASKPVIEKASVDGIEKEKDFNLDFSDISECVEEFTVQLPRKSTVAVPTSNLITINTPQEDQLVKDLSKDLSEVIAENINLLKIDKSVDDEKGDSSSPTDVTESDDSGKNPDIEISDIFNELMEIGTVATASKSSRKKKRKK